MEAVDNVRKTDQYLALMGKAEHERLLSAPPGFNVLQPVGGFGPG
jgi:hypothetical protein